MLHKDIIELIENNKDISLQDIFIAEDIIEVYGSLGTFNKLCKDVTIEDKEQIHKFNRVCANYIRMTNILNNTITI